MQEQRRAPTAPRVKEIDPGDGPEKSESKGERRRSVALFFATFACVYLVYGFQWTGRSTCPSRMRPGQHSVLHRADGDSAQSRDGSLLGGRSHGFSLSLPYFLPFPAAFGTFGAIIRLRSLPKTRSGLLEMGAAGPLAGFAVAVVAIVLGLPATEEHAVPQLVWNPAVLDALAAPVEEATGISAALEPLMAWLGADASPVEVPLMILANPPIMDVIGEWVMGQAPSRYATLDLATAGWVGCLLTAINLVPIGQLDGGHILNAIAPRHSPWVSRALIGVALVAGLLWTGWAFWAVLLILMGAWISLPVPEHPPLTVRAKGIALLTAVTFGLSFMPAPIELEAFPIAELGWVDADGHPIDDETRAALVEALDARLAAEGSGR